MPGSRIATLKNDYCADSTTWQHFYDLVHLVFRSVQQYIFSAFRYRIVKTEQQFVQIALLFQQLLLAINKARFVQLYLHFADCSPACCRSDDIGTASAIRCPRIHRPANYVKVCFLSPFQPDSAQYRMCRDRFSGEPFHPLIIFIFRNGE